MNLTVTGRWADMINSLLPDDPTNDGCERCGKEFTRRNKAHRFCSRSCKQMAWLKASTPALQPLNCMICDVVVPFTGIGPRRKTCSDECRRIHTKRQKSK